MDEEQIETDEEMSQTVVSRKTKESPASYVKHRKKTNYKNLIISALVIIFVVVIVAVPLYIRFGVNNKNESELSGNNLQAYNLISEASYEFKDPISVRLVAGSVYYNSEKLHWSGWFTISAGNGYGASTVGYYYVSYLNGELFTLDLEEDGDAYSLLLAKERDKLNIGEINKKLAEKWGCV